MRSSCFIIVGRNETINLAYILKDANIFTDSSNHTKHAVNWEKKDAIKGGM